MLHVEERISARLPQRGKIGFAEARQDGRKLLISQRMQHDKPFAFALVRNGGDHKHMLGRVALVCAVEEFMQLFFHFDVRDHLAANFAEAAEPVCDGEESIFTHAGDVAGNVPAILAARQRFCPDGQDSPA